LSRKNKQPSSKRKREKNQFCIDYDLEEQHKEEEKIFDTAQIDKDVRIISVFE